MEYQTEMDMMKERFSKLLLGEDMSGSGKGVGTASAISNAITNLCGKSLSQFVVQLKSCRKKVAVIFIFGSVTSP